jgi:hypothetical protein
MSDPIHYPSYLLPYLSLCSEMSCHSNTVHSNYCIDHVHGKRRGTVPLGHCSLCRDLVGLRTTWLDECTCCRRNLLHAGSIWRRVLCHVHTRAVQPVKKKNMSRTILPDMVNGDPCRDIFSPEDTSVDACVSLRENRSGYTARAATRDPITQITKP